MADITDADSDKLLRELLDICARKGNSEAAERLTRRGADISAGVLHSIVDESVRNPEKTDDLLKVYHAVVNNCIQWRLQKMKLPETIPSSDEILKNNAISDNQTTPNTPR